MAHCVNCGTKMSDGLCPNCEEEAFIVETQSEFITDLSDDFARKVADQYEARRKRKQATA